MNGDRGTPHRLGRKLTRYLPVVLALAVTGGGLVCTHLIVDGADRTAATAYWPAESATPTASTEPPGGDRPVGRTDTELSRMLLPVPDGYRLGPDIGEHGNDTALSGVQATALLRERAGEGLTGAERRERDEYYGKLRLKGIAVRSYANDTNDLVMETMIIRMGDKKAVQETYALQTGLYEALGIFRAGPKVDGRHTAACYLRPEDKGFKLDSMTCVAVHGELLLNMRAYGSKPLATTTAVKLLEEQLGHIAYPAVTA
ncbi:hypothetical protein AMK26_03520 [Streptomyces sp. CB03234]|uniref:hypothetical protein n=1 Tax=Streptomyces sp. (strain CB03234) TaxID=1703937 RepID=UPI00093B19A4|nr:hypothetical protein [Streptomyces sp. CB03234]OKK08111.1 hypothetical protein AMK26_03520 [Streptomyces sp. CB03234]